MFYSFHLYTAWLKLAFLFHGWVPNYCRRPDLYNSYEKENTNNDGDTDFYVHIPRLVFPHHVKSDGEEQDKQQNYSPNLYKPNIVELAAALAFCAIPIMRNLFDFVADQTFLFALALNQLIMVLIFGFAADCTFFYACTLLAIHRLKLESLIPSCDTTLALTAEPIVTV